MCGARRTSSPTRLANEAMDAREDVGDPVCAPGGDQSQGSLF